MNRRTIDHASLLMALGMLLLCSLACQSDYVDNLSNGFTYLDEGVSHRLIFGGESYTYTGQRDSTATVPCRVEAFADSDAFLLAEQRPMQCGPGELRTEPVYWLVDHRQRTVHGPLSHPDFVRLRRRLGVPEGLELEPVP